MKKKLLLLPLVLLASSVYAEPGVSEAPMPKAVIAEEAALLDAREEIRNVIAPLETSWISLNPSYPSYVMNKHKEEVRKLLSNPLEEQTIVDAHKIISHIAKTHGLTDEELERYKQLIVKLKTNQLLPYIPLSSTEKALLEKDLRIKIELDSRLAVQEFKNSPACKASRKSFASITHETGSKEIAAKFKADKKLQAQVKKAIEAKAVQDQILMDLMRKKGQELVKRYKN